MNTHQITVHSPLTSERCQGVSPFNILKAIRDICRNSEWRGNQWIGTHEWALELDAAGNLIELVYVGPDVMTGCAPPPVSARIFYAPFDGEPSDYAQRRAFCRLCYWVLTSGLASMDQMPTGSGDDTRINELKHTVHELTAKSLSRSGWASELLKLFLEELEGMHGTGDNSGGSLYLSEMKSPIKTESRSESGGNQDYIYKTPFENSVSEGMSADRPEAPIGINPGSDGSGSETLARENQEDAPETVTNGPAETVQTVAATAVIEEVVDQENPEALAPDKVQAMPEWWRELSGRGNPYTAPRLPRNAKGGVAIEALDVRRHLGLDPFPQATIVFNGLDPNDSSIETGFNFDGPEGVLTGVPKVPGGDYHLVFDVLPPDGLDLPQLRQLIPITINPDPQSLWRTLDPPENSEFRKPHRAGGYHNKDGKITTWASVRGRSHAHEAGHRDDDCRVAEFADGWRLLVVADGAGSAKLARLGSTVAVETSIRSLRQQLESEEIVKWLDDAAKRLAQAGDSEKPNGLKGWEVLVKAAFEAQRAIFDKARELDTDERDFGTTLLICLSRDVGTTSVIGVFSVGDGIVACLGKAAPQLRLLSVPDSGEFAGQTKFLTNRDLFLAESKPYSRLRVAVTDRPSMLIAMTDGVSDPKFSSDESMADPDCWREMVEELTRPLSQMAAEPDNTEAAPLQQWLDFWAVGHHDDRTIALCMDQDFLDSYGAR